MAAYLTADNAATHLYERFGVTTELYDADLEIASDEVDRSGPFIGERYAPVATQPRAFPRSVNPDGSTVTGSTVPDGVLDAVVCLAYALKRGETLGVTSESTLDRSLTYPSPLQSRWILRAKMALDPYRRQYGYPVGTYGSSDAVPWWIDDRYY